MCFRKAKMSCFKKACCLPFFQKMARFNFFTRTSPHHHEALMPFLNIDTANQEITRVWAGNLDEVVSICEIFYMCHIQDMFCWNTAAAQQPCDKLTWHCYLSSSPYSFNTQEPCYVTSFSNIVFRNYIPIYSTHIDKQLRYFSTLLTEYNSARVPTQLLFHQPISIVWCHSIYTSKLWCDCARFFWQKKISWGTHLTVLLYLEELQRKLHEE